MGLFDFLGGSEAQKAQKLKAKVTQKYGDPVSRQKALSQLGEMKSPEAVSALLSRFTLTVEPLTTDADEKEQAFDLIKAHGQDAVGPVKDFLRRTDQASSWAVRLLAALVPEAEWTGVLVEELQRLGAEYTRDPEKKLVLINSLAEKDDLRIAPAMLPLLEDMADDVKIAAVGALGRLKHEPAREPFLALLTHAETAKRVQTAVVAALHESGLGVQGYREKVEARIVDPYFVDRSGLVKKRG